VPFDSIVDLAEQLVHRISAPNRNSLIKPGTPPLENRTTGYYLLVLEHGCFSAKNCVHRFYEQCGTAINALYEWLRQEQDGTKVDLYLFPNELMVSPIKNVEQSYCTVCFPKGLIGECMTEEYLQRITGLSAKEIRDLIDQLPASGEVSA
jgi:hypothetical protein